MTRKEAIELDNVLNAFSHDKRIITVSENEYPACAVLSDMGMVDILNREKRKVRITDKGARFKAWGESYAKQHRRHMLSIAYALASALALVSVSVWMIFSMICN